MSLACMKNFSPFAGFPSAAMLKDSKCGQFLLCLEFAVLNSLYCEIILKPKQVICLEKVFLNFDILAVLPTGYGKSLIFYLLPALLYAKKHGVSKSKVKISSIIVVVSLLNVLIANQISRLNLSGIQATALDVRSSIEVEEEQNEHESEAVVCDFHLSDKAKLEIGHYNIVFAHPEALVSCSYGRKLMQSKAYQENVCAIVVDEAHCILEW